MAGFLHVFAIVGLATITLVTAGFGFARPTWRRVFIAPLAAFGVAALAAVSFHACDAGQPFWQWVVPAIAALIAVLFVGDGRARALLYAGACAVALGLSLHYAAAVHGPTWVGNPRSMDLGTSVASAEWHTPLTGLHRRGLEPRPCPASAAELR